jgi:glycosyltransferase involved in cell wall biosynthesis
LRAAGTEVTLRNVPGDRRRDEPIHGRFTGLEEFPVTLIHVQPEPFFPRAYEMCGLFPRMPRGYRIGYWYWEMDTVPASWDQAALGTDELWAATQFVADALKARFDIPVFTLPPGVVLTPFTRRPRACFGVPEDKFVFLFVFHMTSVMERKNPLGLIRAFARAFRSDEPVVLVLKTTFGESYPKLMDELRAAAAEAAVEVIVIDEIYAQDETLSLIETCDAYVSLHRSEGLGLTMAEAMLLGKPVVATGFSGNTDFMNASNSLLVDYQVVPIGVSIPPYEAEMRWAAPSEEHAAALMRRLFDDRAFAAALGARAKKDLGRNLNIEAAGRRMANRLSEIRNARLAKAVDQSLIADTL